MQEDQIYALQDYITQYQQLLCRYRTENASLRRQLADGTATESPSTVQPLTPPSRMRRSTQPNSVAPPSPQFQTPIPPGEKNPVSPPPPAETPSDLQTPAVPPLNSSGNNLRSNDERASHVVAASYDDPIPETPQDTPVDGEAASAAGKRNEPTHHNAEREDVNAPRSANTILVSGEVVANPSGGPRIMVDVTPTLPENGDLFEGSASLMLLATDSQGQQHNIGRWDFTAEDVHSAYLENAARPTLRFFVELPADTNVEGSTQLWTRLVPHDGAKLLAHAKIDLATPGVFSSRTESDRARLADELVLAANCVEAPPVASDDSTSSDGDTSDDVSEVSTAVNEVDWAVAQPGKPAKLPAEIADKTGAGGWRVSSEPMPAAMVQSTQAAPPAAQPNADQPLLKLLSGHEESTTIEPLAEKPAQRPNWAPERDGEKPSARTAGRPSWSAKR